MTVAVSHKHVSLKADGSDPTLIQPSDWNDAHKMTGTAGSLIGFDANGAASEVAPDGTTVKIANGSLVATNAYAAIVNAAANYQLAASDLNKVVRATASGVVMTLPDPSACAGSVVTTGAHSALTGVVTTSASGNVRVGYTEAVTYTHTGGELITWVSDGTRWVAAARVTADGVSVMVSQSWTAAQQLQGRTNLGIGNIATRALTISSSAPTGGADGDIWLQV